MISPVRAFFHRPWLIAIALGFVVVGARVLWEASASLERAEQAIAADNMDEAVFQYRSAMRWYFPGSSVPEQALNELQGMGEQALQECDSCPTSCSPAPDADCNHAGCRACLFAVHVFDSARAGLLGTRSFYTPFEERLLELNHSMAQALVRAAEVHPYGPRQPRSTRAERLSVHEQELLVDHAPNAFWSVVTVLGFLVWIGGLLRAVSLPRESSGFGGTKGAVLSSVAGFVLWIVGMLSL